MATERLFNHTQGEELISVLEDIRDQHGAVTTEAEISDIVNVYGAKNLIPYPYYRQSGYSHNNMTATYDEDGVLTVNKTTGSNTAFFDFARISDNFFMLPNTKYILSMELENTTNTSVYVQTVSGTDIAAIRNKATGKYEVTFTTGSTVSINVVALYWGADIVETNAKVKVMLRLASIQDNTYVPYAKTNKELTIDTSNIKDSVSSISITGTTNTTGTTIAEDTYFYLNGELVRSKADIASGATLTLNTNYEVITAGGLNEVNSQLKDALDDKQDELHFEVWTVTVANTSAAGSAIGGYYGAAYISSSPQYDDNKWTNKKAAIPLIGRKSGAYNFLTVIGIADGTIYTNSPVADNIVCSILVIY